MTATVNSRVGAQVTRVLIAVSIPLLSLGISTLLAQHPRFHPTVVRANRREILDQLEVHPGAVLLLGTQLACGSGVPGLLAVTKASTSPPCTIVLVPRTAAVLCRVFRAAGADAVIPMETHSEQLVGVLERCLRGEDSLIAVKHPRPDSTANCVDLSVLSPCEMEVFSQVGTGASPRVIAARLGVSPKTVEAHRAHIKSKLGIRTATALNEIAQAWSLWGSSGIDYVI